MTAQKLLAAKIRSPSARKWHFGIATCSDNSRLVMSLKASNCKTLAVTSWLVGQGPDCYYMYQHVVAWKGERCFTALKNALADAAFGRGPEPFQVPEIDEISPKEAENAARNIPTRKRRALISLAEMDLPESIQDAPGVEGYRSTHCPNWTPDTPMYREYKDGFRERTSQRVWYYGAWHNFATTPSRPKEGYTLRHEGDVLTQAVYFTPGLVRAMTALDAA